jgi:riboflavin synthase
LCEKGVEMFTGLVEEAGEVLAIEPSAGGGCRFSVACQSAHEGVKIGDSIATNGCCLTVVKIEQNRLTFDLLEETRRATNLAGLRPGAKINLERSLKVGDRIGGHFVTGHIDGVAVIRRWEKAGSDFILEAEAPSGLERYLVPKGSVALDGISLTVGKVEGTRFNVWIIPHTREVTALSQRAVGDRLNLECDMLAKYVEKSRGGA